MVEPQAPVPDNAREEALRGSVSGAIDSLLGACVELLAAALVAVEIVVLLAGVIARYVFDRPFTWSDELAAIVFLWLAMLGAVIAFRRDEHMRMTAAVGMLAPRRAGCLKHSRPGLRLPSCF